MPIRAILDGHEDVIAPLTSEAWDCLRARLKSKEIRLDLPCCGARAIPRRSPLGTQHFAHFRHGECDWEPESAEHLAAKFEIMKGLRNAGWLAIPEHTGQGWRADVAGKLGDEYKAFEVQWSHQTLEKSTERHERYVGSNVPAYWFFRSLPRDRGFLGAPEDYSNSALLPFFELRLLDKRFMVRFNRGCRSLPLRRLVQLAANGSFQWRRSLSIRTLTVVLISRKSNCKNCGEMVASVGVDSIRNLAPCGLRLTKTRRLDNYFERLVPGRHIPLVEKFLLSEDGKQLGCNLVTLQTKDLGTCGSFACSRCGKQNASWLREDPFEGRQLPGDRKHLISLESKERAYDYPHWCVAGRHGFCSDSESIARTGPWLPTL